MNEQKQNAGLGAWTRSAPTDPGHYWVWQDVETWPCNGAVHCVLVELEGGRMVAWVPFMSFAAEVCSNIDNTWADALWIGPVSPPHSPAGTDGKRVARVPAAQV